LFIAPSSGFYATKNSESYFSYTLETGLEKAEKSELFV